MFNWLGNLFPYSDLHSLNLDWILNKMKETAAQAAKAVADAANALAQVAEAKAAALSAQTAAQNAQTAANNAQTAANNAANSAENAVNVAQAAKNAAETAQSTAETARNTAETARNTADTAQNTANSAQIAANNALNKFPLNTSDIADGAITKNKLGANSVSTDKIADYSITNAKFASVKFYVDADSFIDDVIVTASQLAAGQAVGSFKRSVTNSFIFVAYSLVKYASGGEINGHVLYFYSDPFIIPPAFESVRNIEVVLSDYDNNTGNVVTYNGNLNVKVTSDSRVEWSVTFTNNLPYSDTIDLTFGIAGLSAKPKR